MRKANFFPAMFFIFTFILFFNLFAQDDATYYKATTNFYGKPDTILALKEVTVKAPPSPESFKPFFHFSPIRQDTTGTCWAFSGISFFESEVFRLTGQKFKLSEMYIVYWEYVAKAREYIRTRGKSVFDEGSQEEAVIMRMREHGIVRAEDYSGLLPGETQHNHSKMAGQMKNYLEFVKKNEYWDEEIIIANIKMILNKYLGAPPTSIVVNELRLTPESFLEMQLKLPLDDYVSFMSFKYQPFYTKGSYRVPDNYWHSQEYYNIPLDEWYPAIISALKNGYTVGIGGDVSEIGKVGESDVAFIPPFDIPAKAIDQDAREYRFWNKTSTDDHGIHVLGYQKYKKHDWFLIKDSGSSSNKGTFKGYYFFRGDFIRLKMLTFLVHKDAVENILSKFK